MFIIETVTVTHMCIMHDNSLYVCILLKNLCIVGVMIVDGEVM